MQYLNEAKKQSRQNDLRNDENILPDKSFSVPFRLPVAFQSTLLKVKLANQKAISAKKKENILKAIIKDKLCSKKYTLWF